MTAVESRIFLVRAGRRRENGHGRRGDEIRPVVLTKAVKIQAELIGEFDFLEQVLQPLGWRLDNAAVGGVFGERIEAKLHGSAPETLISGLDRRLAPTAQGGTPV